MIVLEVERQILGDGQQAGGFPRQFRLSAIGGAHDERQFVQRGIVELVFGDEGVETATVSVMPQCHARHIVGLGSVWAAWFLVFE